MRFLPRLTTAIALGLALFLLLGPALHSTMAQPPAGSRVFPETGQVVLGGFLQFFDRYGGVARFGYPITGEFVENGMTVQYFQRARFEWQPANAPDHQVQLGLLGEQLHGTAEPRSQPLPATANRRVQYFTETGHNVTNAFLDYWSRNGALRTFGYPLTEAYTRDGVTFQWFQRARIESRNGRITLGLLGSEWRGGQSALPTDPALPVTGGRSRQFPQTGQIVEGAFLTFWEQRGGEARFGLPLSGEFSENGITVQYFEYARLEWNAASSKVQLGLLGQELYGPAAAAEPPLARASATVQYFPETGHTVSNAFLRHFRQNGGVELFGYPLTETYEENGEIHQWFQRRKLSFAGGTVREAPLGRMRFNPDAEGRHQPQALFQRFLEGNGAIKAALGGGLEGARSQTIAYQPFEGGQMLWRDDTNQILVLYQDGSWQLHNNPWRTGQPVSGGLTPPAGRHEPVLGLGALWRSLGGQGSKLGWATAPQGEGRGLVQRFQFGAMLYNPITRHLYVFYSDGGWFSFDNPWPDQAPK
ncbi:MAG: hypothetical protein H0T73_20070 [Ardenticatenales bacterium]|nr:hypothetical protein [Ardenticatenales bacterium]